VPAAEAVGRALRRTLQRAGHTSTPGRKKPKERRERTGAPPRSLRRDAYVDTAAPGTSASDRRAGYGATAARNTLRRTSGMTSALEDSRTRPSRKSTRKSTNRTRAAAGLELRATLRTRSSKSRAARARARRSR
jgi:hypothetical protein